MQTENIDYKEIESIRQEIQFLKNRIDLIEAALDIQEWKHDLSDSVNDGVNDDDLIQNN